MRERCRLKRIDLAALVLSKEDPTGGEVVGSNSGELLLELVERAEVTSNQISELASGGTATIGLHAIPVEGVVPDLSGDEGGEGWAGEVINFNFQNNNKYSNVLASTTNRVAWRAENDP